MRNQFCEFVDKPLLKLFGLLNSVNRAANMKGHVSPKLNPESHPFERPTIYRVVVVLILHEPLLKLFGLLNSVNRAANMKGLVSPKLNPESHPFERPTRFRVAVVLILHELFEMAVLALFLLSAGVS